MARWRIGEQFQKRKTGGVEWAGGLHPGSTGTGRVNRISNPTSLKFDEV